MWLRILDALIRLCRNVVSLRHRGCADAYYKEISHRALKTRDKMSIRSEISNPLIRYVFLDMTEILNPVIRSKG